MFQYNVQILSLTHIILGRVYLADEINKSPRKLGHDLLPVFLIDYHPHICSFD